MAEGTLLPNWTHSNSRNLPWAPVERQVLFDIPSIPDAHCLLFLVDLAALLAIHLLMLILLPLLVLLLKQPRELGHKGADRLGNAGDIHWLYGIDSIGFIHRIGG